MKLQAFYRRGSTALVVLLLGLLLTALAAFTVAGQLEREERMRFESAARSAQAAVVTRIEDYADVLRGLGGLFAASESVSREAFRRYFANLDLAQRYPGIQVIHYSQRISAAERPEFEARIRRDTSVDPRGYPGFAIRPSGERSEYVVAQYVEPMAGNERALGLDLAGDAVRLAALQHTRDSGRITASGTIALALDPSRHPGFAMRLAIYRNGAPTATVEQRRAAFTGVVSASFVAIDLMRGVLSEAVLRSLRMRIHDAGFLGSDGGLQPPSADNLMFDSNRLSGGAALPVSAGGQAAGLSSTAPLVVGGRRWNLYFDGNPGQAEGFERWLPWLVVLGGSAISLLLAALIHSLVRTGRAAVELAERITGDLRRSEEELRATNERLQLLIESSPLAIYTRDPGGLLTSWNPAAERLYGWKAAEVLGKPLPSVPGEKREESDAFRMRLLAGEQFLKFEGRRVRRDGSPIEIEAFLGQLRDAAGNASGIIAVVADITERKHAEKALRESESRYRSVVAAIAEGVLLRDVERRIVACNASAERILGRTLEQMKGNAYFDPAWQAIREDGSTFPDEERPATAAMRTGRLQSNVTMGFRKQDGSVLWLSMSAQPLFEESGSAPSGVVTTIADVTQRKQVELQQAMEHRVTRLLSESETLEEVMPRLIQILCEALGCACGARWLRDDEAQVVARAETWSTPSTESMEFVALSGEAVSLPLAPGGLIRRAWDGGEPVWIDDVAQEAGFRRAPLAAKAGLHGAFAFPIRFGNEVLGVMEFFSHDSRPPGDMLVQSTRLIGSQIGQFMARRQAEERVRHLVNYDELTALPNRSMFHQRADHALAQARRNAKALALLFIDLDRFKNINDTLGHDAGDRVLKDVADRLRGCLRESDTVGRLGGDEFVVLIEDMSESSHVAEVARKIIAAVARPIVIESQEVHVTASIGISTYPDDSADIESLMKNADISMYRAKEQGKNNYQFYSAQMNLHTLDRLAMESGLRRALERDEFLLHYQPKIDIGSGRITGMEALVRWQPPEGALVSPAQFIPLAEETGLIVPIGAWVLATACARNKTWQDQGLPPMRIAVNLSARQFAQENLVQDVARTLAETGLDVSSLEFEITESMVMRDPEHTIKLLGGLKAMGIHLSIDDFGTGYSSLSHLKRFPLDSVKIDRSFIQDLPGDADDAAITRAIIAMAHSLRLKVIAEGVETEEQLRFLREHGCDELQGYLFSKPLPEEEFVRLVRGRGRHGPQGGRRRVAQGGPWR